MPAEQSSFQLSSALRRPAARPTRFVVLSQPRTGSSLLCGSIRWHPQILMQGEILNHRYERPDLPAHSGADRLRVALSVATHAAVGCKLHACQPDPGSEHWESAWDELFADPTIKVVHLARQDTLAQLASWKIAEQLNRWGDQLDVRERPVIRIDPAELIWFRRWNATADRVRMSRLQRHPLLAVNYESLRDRWESTVEMVLRFIGVEPIPLDPCATRNETRPLDQVIVNYAELVGNH
jgi:LPS sulfotransferase NodH